MCGGGVERKIPGLGHSGSPERPGLQLDVTGTSRPQEEDSKALREPGAGTLGTDRSRWEGLRTRWDARRAQRASGVATGVRKVLELAI